MMVVYFTSEGHTYIPIGDDFYPIHSKEIAVEWLPVSLLIGMFRFRISASKPFILIEVYHSFLVVCSEILAC
jgi:hypothetical protein